MKSDIMGFIPLPENTPKTLSHKNGQSVSSPWISLLLGKFLLGSLQIQMLQNKQEHLLLRGHDIRISDCTLLPFPHLPRTPTEIQ